MKNFVSINADIGEGYGMWTIADDRGLLDLITDANLACGFHAGDPDIMRETCEVAVANGLGLGAHVGFYDLRGFGRHFIAAPPRTITNDVVYQIGAAMAMAMAAGGVVSYVKPHGGLYHAAVAQPEYAEAIVDAICLVNASMPILCQPGTGLAETANSAGLHVIAEGYLDRAYTADGLLVPRGTPGAVLRDPDQVSSRAVAMIGDGVFAALDGSSVQGGFDSLCVHSDSPGAVEVTSRVTRRLRDAGVALRPIRDRVT